jgi:hypothetical protein
MSEYEDRQDAAPAIVAPAAETPAPAMADTGDLEAVAAVEGTTEDSADQAAESNPPATPLPVAGPLELVASSTSSDMDAEDDTDGDTDTDTDAEDDEPPLLDDALEEGIASVFAALQAAAGSGEIGESEEPFGESEEPFGESDEPYGPLSDSEAVDGITFRLLGELDRLWHRAA